VADDSTTGGTEALVDRVFEGWTVGRSDEQILESLAAEGLTASAASHTLEVIAHAAGIAVLLEAGLNRAQFTSDLDGDPLFSAALKRATEKLPEQDSNQLRSLVELATALASGDAYARQDAVFELGQTGNVSAVGLLISALADEDEYVRIYSAQAVGELRSPQAVPALSALAESDEKRTVVCNALTALAQIGDKAALPALVAATKHQNAFVRYDALTAIGDLGACRA